MKKRLNIWHFPTWYPHRHNLSLGSFVKKQIVAASSFSNQVVFYVFEDADITDNFSLTINEEGNLLEIFIAILPSNSKFRILRDKKKAYQLAVNEARIKNIQPDFIHAHSISFASFVAKKIAKKNKLKWFLSEHWSGFLKAAKGFEKMPYFKKKIWLNHANQANAIVCISKTLKEAMIQSGVTNSNYKIIPNVVEGNFPLPTIGHKTVGNESNQKFIFLNVSDMVDEIKNISSIVRVFNQVWKQNKATELWLVGDGKDSELIIDLIKKLPSKEAIKFLGRLTPEEVIELYPQISVTVINSRYETFSVVAAESLYAGKPIISTKCGGPEEFVNNEQGILISIDNDAELFGAMENMLSSYAKYIPIELHQHIERQFSKEKIVFKLQDLYQ